MCDFERDQLRVNVPVGFLLPEAREIIVSVERPTDVPLAIRLRLIPAQPPDIPRAQSAVPTRRLAAWETDDGYHQPDLGGGD